MCHGDTCQIPDVILAENIVIPIRGGHYVCLLHLEDGTWLEKDDDRPSRLHEHLPDWTKQTAVILYLKAADAPEPSLQLARLLHFLTTAA